MFLPELPEKPEQSLKLTKLPWLHMACIIRENCYEILRCCRKYHLPLLLSSDSHGPEHIGDFTCAAEFVHQAMFPEQLILNNQLPRLKVFLQTR